MSGTMLILAGFIGFVAVCTVDMFRKHRADDDSLHHKHHVRQVTGPDGTTHIWHVE